MPVHVVHTGRPSGRSATPVDWAVDRVLSWPTAITILTPFDFRSLRYLLYLLSPYNLTNQVDLKTNCQRLCCVGGAIFYFLCEIVFEAHCLWRLISS